MKSLASFRTLASKGYYNSFRNLCVQLNREPSGLPEEDSNHIFKRNKLIKKHELVTFFKENVVYNKNGLVVLNKPTGIGRFKVPDGSHKWKPTTIPSSSLSMEEILPDLAKIFGYKSLHIACMPERHASGVTLLAGKIELANRLRKSFFDARSRSKFTRNKLFLTVGVPKLPVDCGLHALKLDVRKISDVEKKVPIFAKQYTRNDIKRGRVHLSRIYHQVISSSQHVSLCKAGVTQRKFTCLRMYMAIKCFAPILGDSYLGARISVFNNSPVVVDHFSDLINFPKPVPKEILTLLQLGPEESPIVPLFYHLHTVTLPQFTKPSSLHVVVPPPESFIWACERLGVEIPAWVTEQKVEFEKRDTEEPVLPENLTRIQRIHRHKPLSQQV